MPPCAVVLRSKQKAAFYFFNSLLGQNKKAFNADSFLIKKGADMVLLAPFAWRCKSALKRHKKTAPAVVLQGGIMRALFSLYAVLLLLPVSFVLYIVGYYHCTFADESVVNSYAGMYACLPWLIRIQCLLQTSTSRDHKTLYARVMIGIWSSVALAIFANWGIPAWQAQHTLPAKTIGPELYRPFTKNSALAQLDSASSLRMESPYPILDGAIALVPMYAAVIEAAYPPESVSRAEDSAYQHNNTIGGYRALIAGDVDVLFAAYPSKKQMEDAKRAKKQLHFLPIGREAFVFFVHRENPVRSLTQEQLRDIYAGHLTNWRDVGGANASILAFQRNSESGSQSALIRFMKKIPLMTPPQERRSDGMLGIIEKASAYQNRGNAIGFSFRYFVLDMVANSTVRLLAVDGIDPAEGNIHNGTYPLINEFYAVTATAVGDDPLATTEDKAEQKARQRNVQLLMQWLVSPEGQELIRKSGYTGVAPKTSS